MNDGPVRERSHPTDNPPGSFQNPSEASMVVEDRDWHTISLADFSRTPKRRRKPGKRRRNCRRPRGESSHSENLGRSTAEKSIRACSSLKPIPFCIRRRRSMSREEIVLSPPVSAPDEKGASLSAHPFQQLKKPTFLEPARESIPLPQHAYSPPSSRGSTRCACTASPSDWY
jgi:hypothetical protein